MCSIRLLRSVDSALFEKHSIPNDLDRGHFHEILDKKKHFEFILFFSFRPFFSKDIHPFIAYIDLFRSYSADAFYYPLMRMKEKEISERNGLPLEKIIGIWSLTIGKLILNHSKWSFKVFRNDSCQSSRMSNRWPWDLPWAIFCRTISKFQTLIVNLFLSDLFVTMRRSYLITICIYESSREDHELAFSTQFIWIQSRDVRLRVRQQRYWENEVTLRADPEIIFRFRGIDKTFSLAFLKIRFFFCKILLND